MECWFRSTRIEGRSVDHKVGTLSVACKLGFRPVAPFYHAARADLDRRPLRILTASTLLEYSASHTRTSSQSRGNKSNFHMFQSEMCRKARRRTYEVSISYYGYTTRNGRKSGLGESCGHPVHPVLQPHRPLHSELTAIRL